MFLPIVAAMIASPDRSRFPILMFTAAITALPLNMVVPSLPDIARDLHADFALVNVAVAGYAAVSALTYLLAGALSDRFGRRPVIMTALAILTLASAACSLADSIGMFLACRLAQGTSIAAYTACLACLRDTSDEQMAASRIGYFASVWAIAPLVGPTLGGVLDTLLGWRSNFVALAFLGAIGLGLSALCLQETNRRPSSSLIQPFRGYGGLIGSPLFWAYSLCTAFSIGTFYAFLGGAPLVAAQRIGDASMVLGLYMAATPAGFILGSTLAGGHGRRHAPLPLMVAGRLLTCLGPLAGLAFHACGVTHSLAFFGPCVFIGLGNGLTMPGASAGVMSLRPGLAGTASGLASALTVGGGAAVSFVSGLIVTPANASYAVLGVMLVSSSLALASALGVVALRKAMGSA